MMKQSVISAFLATAAIALAPTQLYAQAAAPGGMEAARAAPSAMNQEIVSAEVKAVDKASGRVTLAHGEAKALGLPAATNAFTVRDAAMLEGLSEGAKVRVALARSPLGIVVVQIEPSA